MFPPPHIGGLPERNPEPRTRSLAASALLYGRFAQTQTQSQNPVIGSPPRHPALHEASFVELHGIL